MGYAAVNSEKKRFRALYHVAAKMGKMFWVI